jgi:hypothetical protein
MRQGWLVLDHGVGRFGCHLQRLLQDLLGLCGHPFGIGFRGTGGKGKSRISGARVSAARRCLSPQAALGQDLEPAHLPWNTKWAFQGFAIPAARIRCGRIGGEQEFEQQSLGIRGIAYRLVWQNELA